MAYLTRINKTYYLRLAIPRDLQHHFPANQIKRSLRTCSRTDARRLLATELCAIEELFYSLRLGGVVEAVKPSDRAIEIFKKRYGAKASIFEAALPGEPTVPGTAWKYAAELCRIEAKLAAGYEIEPDGFFHLEGAPPAGLPALPQAVPPAPAYNATKTVLTLGAARDLYLDAIQNPERPAINKPRKPGTMSSERTAIKHLINFMGGEHVLVSALPLDMYPFTQNYLSEKLGHKNDTINTRTNRLSYFFKYLKDKGHIAEIPKIETYKKNRDGQGNVIDSKPNRPYSNEELTTLFQYLIDNTPINRKTRKKHLQLMYMLLAMLHTGFRVSELIVAEFETLTAEKIPVLNNPKQKNDLELNARYVPLHRELLKLGYQHYRKKSGKLSAITDASKYFRTIIKKLGFASGDNECTFHSCRKTFDTRIAGKVADVIRHRLMGHASSNMDQRYVKQLPDDAPMYRDAINKLQYDIDYKHIRTYLLQQTELLY